MTSMRCLQFGTGRFLRGFWDWMLQRAHEKAVLDVEVTVVKLTARGDLADFERQRGVFHHVVRDLDVFEVTRVDRIREWIHPYEEWSTFLATARRPEFGVVVSNSTEAGIEYVDCAKPAGKCPASFPAKLCAWLAERHSAFGADAERGVIVLPFELIDDNADRLREIVSRHARDWGLDESFNAWLDTACVFANTLVDRIVTQPTTVQRDEIAELANAGLADDRLQTCSESFHLLAIEAQGDGEARARRSLPLDRAALSVLWTRDLAPIRERKIRILNGSHMFLAFLGPERGCATVRDAYQHPELGPELRRVVREEIIESMLTDDSVESERMRRELEEYAESVLARFDNPQLEHALESIRLEARKKMKARILPSILGFKARHDRLPDGLMRLVRAFFVAEPAAVDDWPPEARPD